MLGTLVITETFLEMNLIATYSTHILTAASSKYELYEDPSMSLFPLSEKPAIYPVPVMYPVLPQQPACLGQDTVCRVPWFPGLRKG